MLHRVQCVRWGMLVSVLLLGVIVLGGCGGKDDEPTVYHVAAIMQNAGDTEIWLTFIDDMATRGYTAGENIVYYNEPSVDLLAEQVEVDDLDLMLVIGGGFGGSEQNGLTQAKALVGDAHPLLVASTTGDPVASGDVASLSEPGGNITGILQANTDAKRFELFVDLLPLEAERVAVIYDPGYPSAVEQIPDIETVAAQVGLELLLVEIPSGEIPAHQLALSTMPGDIDGIFLLKVWGVAHQWFQWAYDHHVLSSQDTSVAANTAQPAMTYGPSSAAIGAQAARFADQILKGANPAQLPLEYSQSFLTIDLNIAEAYGLEIPDTMLTIADTRLRSDMSVFATPLAIPTLPVVQHPPGDEACAGTLTTMGGSFTICATTSCFNLTSTSTVTYSELQSVGACSSEKLVGTCAGTDFDTLYYTGDPGALQIGCGFMSGKWSVAGAGEAAAEE